MGFRNSVIRQKRLGISAAGRQTSEVFQNLGGLRMARKSGENRTPTPFPIASFTFHARYGGSY